MGKISSLINDVAHLSGKTDSSFLEPITRVVRRIYTFFISLRIAKTETNFMI